MPDDIVRICLWSGPRNLRQHCELLRHLQALGQQPLVLDATQLLLGRRAELTEVCERIGIEFEPTMLQRPRRPRPEDGIGANHWQTSVHQSTAFLPHVAKAEGLPRELEPLWRECLPYYEELRALAIEAK